MKTFNAAPDMRVSATAADGVEAVQAVRNARPDVITMDVNMPRMDGLQATRLIMHECPVPIVIVSSMRGDQVSASFRALESGALAFVRSPVGPHDPAHASAVAELVQTVRLMSEVRVVRRYGDTGADTKHAAGAAPERFMRARDIKAVAIGASTGGPLAVCELLGALPKPFFAPILLVQHIAVGFVAGFAKWLSEATGHAVQIANDAEPLLPGHVYIAPDEHHMGVDRFGVARLSTAAPEQGLRPAVSYLFRTVLAAYGGNAAAVLLSGMGKDGAQGLRDLKEAGALTFVQSRESALVFGMPGEAVRLDAARHIMKPAEIGAALAAIIGRG